MWLLSVRRWNVRCAVKGGCDQDDSRRVVFLFCECYRALCWIKQQLQQSWSSPRWRSRIPPHARQCTVDDIEFHSLKLLQHLANASCKPVTLWPSQNYGPRCGARSLVTHGDGRTRVVPANAAKGSMPLVTLLPRHYHARIVRHYHASWRWRHSRESCSQLWASVRDGREASASPLAQPRQSETTRHTESISADLVNFQGQLTRGTRIQRRPNASLSIWHNYTIAAGWR
jgi:hypothetical protein